MKTPIFISKIFSIAFGSRVKNKNKVIKFDHIFLFSSDIQKSSLFLSSILGLSPAQYCGADMDILRLNIDEAGALQYHHSSDDIPKQHIAFQVDINRFDEIVNRL